MARTTARARNTVQGPGRKTGNRPKSTRPAGHKSRIKNTQRHEQHDWDDTSDDPDTSGNIEGLLDRSPGGTRLDAEARRRIEILREERALQQALDDGFDF